MSNRENIFRVVRWCIRLSPIFIMLWVVYQNFVPLGTLTLRCTATTCDQRIQNFASKEPDFTIRRLQETDDFYRVITVDPLYFDAELFRPMRRAEVSIVYQNPDEQPTIKLGVLGSGDGYGYKLLPIQSSMYSLLEAKWKSVRKNGITLFMRPDPKVKTYRNVDDFLADSVRNRRTAMLNFGSLDILPIPHYQRGTEKRTHDVGVRGPHAFVFYVGEGEPLDVEFVVKDINRHKGKDHVRFRVSRMTGVVQTTTLPDDGEIRQTGEPSAARIQHVSIPNTTEGVYIIDVLTESDDVFLQEIRTPNSLMMVQGNLYVAESEEYSVLGGTNDAPLTVYFRGKQITARTSHEDALQTIRVGQRALTLNEVGEARTIKVDAAERFIPVTIPIRDVYLQSDGVFVFSEQQSFDFKRFPFLANESDLSLYDYVIARVPDTFIEQGAYLTQETVDIPNRRKVSFVIVGDPQLGGSGRELLIKEIRIRFSGDRLTPETFFQLARETARRIRATGSLK